MRLELVTQPDASNSNLYEFLAGVLADPDFTSITMVAAWANHRGLARLVPTLRAFRARPARAEIILGIDEGGATEQGLRLAAAEFDESWVFYTNDDRTFHPKLYLSIGPDRASAFVGSNNLTPGGLFYNFEAGVKVDLECGPAAAIEDAAFLADVTGYIRRLKTDTEVCKPLSPNLDRIIRDPAFDIRDEVVRRGRVGFQPIDPDADKEVQDRPALFGRSSQPARPPVSPGDPIPRQDMMSPGRTRRAAASGTSAVASGPARARLGVVVHRWFRPLDSTAAQRPPNPMSNPTGNIRLTQAGHGIDQTTYFRDQLFGGVQWNPEATSRGLRESTEVNMEVVVDGRSLGEMTFSVSHAAHREAGQGNVTTVLHVGPLAGEFGANDYTGRVLTIEQNSAGQYRLTIDTAPSGTFEP